MRIAHFWLPSTLLLLCCSGIPEISGPGTDFDAAGSGGNGGRGGSEATAGTQPDIGLAGSPDTPRAGSGGTGGVDTSGCGDGLLQATTLGEVCDDGNSVSGDGCSADCLAVEAG